jgi:predicted RNase H-like HicB family nuclease
MRYAIIIEKSATGFGAYAPDLPGVGVVGESADEVRRLIREAIELHLEGLRVDGMPAPEPSVEIEYVETRAA